MKIIVALLLFFASCARHAEKTSIPTRPETVPFNAFWKAGYWFVVNSINDHRNNTNISIYSDQDGKLIVSQKFMKICPIDNLEFIKNLEKEITAYDGQNILLNSRCYLMPR